ncbi:unnamed protein product [Bursaphelenchus xylophilus]|uniref:UDP-N-acetylglucosamine transferase subunit ALG13 n=1 Tax=Bursaphelenchus xylophilus TaxID=6326 RepID=A0A1I7S2H1_BURXY|nr:unnamed protein product [Bursaphelenchus xylophilus]CAG9114551.1 unnamed protein product [Bursaphelenchus xylophilus]
MGKVCLVTVGSTKFDGLIDEVLRPAVLKRLAELEFDRLVIQCGAGASFEKFSHKSVVKENGDQKIRSLIGEQKTLEWQEFGINIVLLRYVDSLLPLIHLSNVVIGHGGAGTILEVTRAKKTLFVVVNRSLMSDHQTELAEELAKTRDLHFVSEPSELLDALKKDVHLNPNVDLPTQEERQKILRGLYDNCNFVRAW